VCVCVRASVRVCVCVCAPCVCVCVCVHCACGCLIDCDSRGHEHHGMRDGRSIPPTTHDERDRRAVRKDPANWRSAGADSRTYKGQSNGAPRDSNTLWWGEPVRQAPRLLSTFIWQLDLTSSSAFTSGISASASLATSSTYVHGQVSVAFQQGPFKPLTKNFLDVETKVLKAGRPEHVDSTLLTLTPVSSNIGTLSQVWTLACDRLCGEQRRDDRCDKTILIF
jgi:hypothetical protein